MLAVNVAEIAQFVEHSPEQRKVGGANPSLRTFEVVMPAVPHYNMDWQCKHCNAKQTVYIGDPEDLTYPDVEAVRCCNCKKLELTMDDTDFRAIHGLYDEETDKPLQITEQVIEEYAFIENGMPL